MKRYVFSLPIICPTYVRAEVMAKDEEDARYKLGGGCGVEWLDLDNVMLNADVDDADLVSVYERKDEL